MEASGSENKQYGQDSNSEQSSHYNEPSYLLPPPNNKCTFKYNTVLSHQKIWSNFISSSRTCIVYTFHILISKVPLLWDELINQNAILFYERLWSRCSQIFIVDQKVINSTVTCSFYGLTFMSDSNRERETEDNEKNLLFFFLGLMRSWKTKNRDRN